MSYVFVETPPPRSPAGRQRGRSAWMLALPTFLLVSCLHRHPGPAPAAPPTPNTAALKPRAASLPSATLHVTREHRIGVVRVIGARTRFVLIEAPLAGARSLPDGQLMRSTNSTMTDSPTTAILRVTHERRQPFVVADVVAGDPHIGDVIFLASPTASEPNTPLVLPTSTSGVLPIALPGAAPSARNP